MVNLMNGKEKVGIS